jgi:hypothetical protein
LSQAEVRRAATDWHLTMCHARIHVKKRYSVIQRHGD